METEGQGGTGSVYQEIDSGPHQVLSGQHPVASEDGEVSDGVVELGEEAEPDQQAVEIHDGV